MRTEDATARNTARDTDRNGVAARNERLLRWLVFTGYLAIVVFTAAHHEMWRDEVRAWSLAREGTLRNLFSQLRFEGHPAVWYLLLRGGYLLTGSRLVLPVLSLMVAATAVYLLLRYAPFSWPQKILLVLGVFPLFEYSVVARNYGLGMLLIILLAILYPTRLQRPVRWTVLLALLANTSAHGTVIAIALLFGTGWDVVAGWRNGTATLDRRIRRWLVWLSAAIGITGLIVARATVSSHIVTDAPAGVPRARTVVHQVAISALNPGPFLGALLPSPTAELGDSQRGLARSTAQTIAIDAIMLLLVAGLWGEWSLLLIAGVAVSGSGALFQIVYQARMRHLGLLWFVFVLVYWEMARRRGADPAAHRRRVRWSLAVPLTAMMVLQAIEGLRRTRQDITGALSSSAAVGELLLQPDYRAAIVMATRDAWLESLPYYSQNRLFFHTQRRFESHVNFTLRGGGDHIGVRDLIALADSVAVTTGSPIVLLVPGHAKAATSAADSLALQRRTTEVASLDHAIGDESYDVRLLRSVADSGSSHELH